MTFSSILNHTSYQNLILPASKMILCKDLLSFTASLHFYQWTFPNNIQVTKQLTFHSFKTRKKNAPITERLRTIDKYPNQTTSYM